GASIGWGGLGTSSPFSANQFVYTNNAGSLVTAASSSLSLPNTALANSSVTVTAGTNLTGGGSVALGSSITLNGMAYPFPSNATSTLLSFNGNASTTALSVFQKAFFGGTATTTIDATVNTVIPSGSSLTNTGVSNGCGTWASGVLGSTGVACGSGGGSSFSYPF